MKKELDQNQILDIQHKLSAAESAIMRVPISAIEVNEKCLAAGRILVKGKEVRVGSSFFKRLGSLLRINSSLTNDMINKGDVRVAAALINGLKDYRIMNKKENDILLVANVATKEVVDICQPSRYKRITNDTLFDITDKIMNETPSLIVESVDFNPNNGRTSINFLNDNEIGFAKAGKDEFFKFGFSIVQTNRTTFVETYNQRLVCTNGLRTSLGQGAIGSNTKIAFEDKFSLSGTGSEDIREFLNKINAMHKADFVPVGFEEAIVRACNTKASLDEIENALRVSTKKLMDPDPELLKRYQQNLGYKYFHGYGDAMARVTKKGVDAGILTVRQKQFVKTSMSIWDVVNSLTFLGSNNSGFPIDNQHELKAYAGELFAKGVTEGYDLEFADYATL